MYYFMALITGLVISVMVAINGGLTAQYGVFGATIIVHIIGSIFALLVVKVSHKKVILSRNIPLWLYLGGILGVLTIVFNNLAFGKISLTSIIALSLFGQTVTSLIVDTFGLLGMNKYKFKKSSIVGLLFALSGVVVMMGSVDGVALLAVVLSFCTGITIVISRTINAVLSEKIGVLQGSFINHIVGLPFSVITFMILGGNDLIRTGFVISANGWIYLGGILGVIVVLLCNIIVIKISSFHLTLLTFVGQIFTGIILDLITKSGFTSKTFIGGILVSVGIGINMLIDQVINKKRKESIGQ